MATPAIPWKVTGDFWGKIKRSGAHEASEDVSGLACAAEATGGRLCVLVDDESQGAQVVLLRDGELVAGDYLSLISNTHDGKPVELDAEAVAYADGNFYVAGSHGRARHEENAKEEAENVAKAKASKHLIRLHFAPGALDPSSGKVADRTKVSTTVSTALPGLIQTPAALKASLDKPLLDNGLTIEGLAVRGDTAWIGFRGPVIDGDAVILSASLKTLFDGAAGRGEPRKVKLGADGAGKARAIRDLVADDDGLLGIAGPVNDPAEGVGIACGDYAVFRLAPDGSVSLRDLPPFAPPSGSRAGKPLKPEGLTLLGSAAGAQRVLITFDGPAGGAPTPVDLTFPAGSACPGR